MQILKYTEPHSYTFAVDVVVSLVYEFCIILI